MSQNIKLSPSFVESAANSKPHLQHLVSKIRALDTNNDGEIDAEELAEAVDQMVKTQRENRLIKWFLFSIAIFSMLTIAAVVGLTFAVVQLSKDTKVSDTGALVSKGNGEVLRE